jgi:PAS domain S-box-containing protein
VTRPKVRLRTVLVLLVLATTTPLGLFAGWLVWSSWQQQLALVDRQSVETARAISVAIDQEVENTTAALGVLAALDLLDAPDLAAFQEFAIRLLPSQPGWHAVVLVDPSGRLRANTAARLTQPGTLLADDWVQAIVATGRPAVSRLVEDRATRQHFVTIGVPVIRDGALKFVLGAQLRSSSLSDILRQQNIPANGVVTLVDGAQRILARTRNEDEFLGRPPSADFHAMSLKAAEGSWRTRMLEGTPGYAAMSRSARTGWTVGIGRPAEEVDGPIRRAVWALSGVGAAILALGLGAALLMGQRLVQSLTGAARSAQALAQGQPVLAGPSRIVELDGLAAGLHEAGAILDRRLHERDQAERARARAAEEREQALLAEQAAQAAREREEARLAVTLRSIGDAVVATDAAGQVTLLNPVAQALMGCAEADALGRPLEAVFTIVNEYTRQRVESPVTKVFREGRVVGLANHTLLLARDGREIPIADSAAPIPGAGGVLQGVVLVFRDVSDQRAAERQKAALLEQEHAARRAAETLNRGKDEFVAAVSHELRNPLNAVLGWVRLLQSGTLDPAAQAHAVEVIDRNTRAQAQLIEDLLDMSRVLTGKVRLAMRRLDVGPVLQAAVDTVRPTAEVKEQALVLTTEPTASLVMGDPDRLQQIA